MTVKTSFKWRRPCSCIPWPIEIPAGAPVEKRNGLYWVKPYHFSDMIVRHDAVHYGCLVSPDNVQE